MANLESENTVLMNVWRTGFLNPHTTISLFLHVCLSLQYFRIIPTTSKTFSEIEILVKTKKNMIFSHVNTWTHNILSLAMCLPIWTKDIEMLHWTKDFNQVKQSKSSLGMLLPLSKSANWKRMIVGWNWALQIGKKKTSVKAKSSKY